MSRWMVWQDPSDDNAYAMWTANHEKPDAEKRVWRLTGTGEVAAVSAAVLPQQPVRSAIDQLGDVSDAFQLTGTGGAVIEFADRLYARHRAEVYRFDRDTEDWTRLEELPPGLVKLRGGGWGSSTMPNADYTIVAIARYHLECPLCKTAKGRIKITEPDTEHMRLECEQCGDLGLVDYQWDWATPVGVAMREHALSAVEFLTVWLHDNPPSAIAQLAAIARRESAGV